MQVGLPNLLGAWVEQKIEERWICSLFGPGCPPSSALGPWLLFAQAFGLGLELYHQLSRASSLQSAGHGLLNLYDYVSQSFIISLYICIYLIGLICLENLTNILLSPHSSHPLWRYERSLVLFSLPFFFSIQNSLGNFTVMASTSTSNDHFWILSPVLLSPQFSLHVCTSTCCQAHPPHGPPALLTQSVKDLGSLYTQVLKLICFWFLPLSLNEGAE